MARIKKNKLGAIKNRKRVQFHRKWKKLLKQREDEIRLKIANQIVDSTSESFNLKDHEQSKQISLEDKLKSWATNNNISMRALDKLLEILISAGHKSLPRCYRTLLKTPRNIEINNSLISGKYWYRGVAECLKVVFSKLNKNLSIKLKFNVDGLPIFNSSKFQFWPILASIHRE